MNLRQFTNLKQVRALSIVNGTIYFQAEGSDNDAELYYLDSDKKAVKINVNPNPDRTSNPSQITDVNGTVYFIASGGDNDRELYYLDNDNNPVKIDVNSVRSSYPSNITNVNGTVYFTANDINYTAQLYYLNNEKEPVEISINPNGRSSPSNITNVNGTVYFISEGSDNDLEIYYLDAENNPIKIDVNSNGSAFPTISRRITKINDTIYFQAKGSDNETELYYLDSNKKPVKIDVNTNGDSKPSEISNVNGTVYFHAKGSDNDVELYYLDSDNKPIKIDVNINGDSYPREISNVNGTVYFRAIGSDNDVELYYLDGDNKPVKIDVNINGDSYPSEITDIDGTAYFLAIDSNNNQELYYLDNDKKAIKIDVNPDSDNADSNPNEESRIFDINVVDDTIYFIRETSNLDDFRSRDSSESKLWIYNLNNPPIDLDLSNNTVVENEPPNSEVGKFTTTDPDTDDTFTYTLVDGEGSTDNSVFSIIGNELRINASPDFETKNTYSIRIRTTDQGELSYEKVFTVNVNNLDNEAPVLTGTPQIVKDIASESSSANPSNLTLINNTLYFTADDGIHGTELWKSNGNSGTTVLVKDIASGINSANVSNLTVVDNLLYFTADDKMNGTALWKSDGSKTGTLMVKQIGSGSSGSNLSNLTNLNGTLYFTVNDGVNGTELWKSDGTSAGTVLVKDIRTSGSSFPSKLVAINSTLYFTADDGNNGRELWKSDGTEAGTVLLKDIGSGSNGSFPYHLTNINGTLYFTADDGVNGVELWKSDGTPTGTVIVKDIFADSIGSNPSNLTDVNGILYFTGSDDTHGGELWKSDGTPAGTVLVKDIAPGSDTSNIFNLTNVNGILYFTANNGANGEELWKSDGTEVGTLSVKDIIPGESGSNPSNLTNINGTLYFTADDGNNGRELWKSDGFVEGTVKVEDINPGSDGSNVANLININDIPYFTANDGTNGIELFHLSSRLTNQIILQGTSKSIPFMVSDTESNANQLTVTATSSNPNLLPESNILIAGTDSNRTLTFTPQAGEVGNTTVTLNVSDGVNTSSIPFDVTVASTLLKLDTTSIQQFEGQNGTTIYTFTVTRTGDLSSTSTANYAVVSSAVYPINTEDFGGTLPSGTVTFDENETTQTITINVSGDTLKEPDEDFILTLSNPTNATIDTAIATATILDDDPAPTLAISPPNISKNEGDRNETPFIFTVTRKGNLRQTSTVDYRVLGSGTNPADTDDFGGTLPSGTVTFAPNEAIKTISVNVVGDTDLEQDKSFTVELRNAAGSGTSITTATSSGTILDDDYPRVTLSISTTELNENGGSSILTASLDKVFTEDVTIGLGLFNGRAKRDIDYTVADSLVIPAGETSVTTELQINDDKEVEGEETFFIDIVSMVNALPAQSVVQRVNGTIVDDDYPDVSINLASSSVTEDGFTNLVYTIARSVATQQPLTVNYTVSGTATPGSDYGNLSNSVVIPAGQTSVAIVVNPNSDRVAEINETVVVTLEAGVNYNLSSNTISAIGTIQDDDPVKVSIGNTQVTEGTNGVKKALVDVRLSNPSSAPITIDYATTRGTTDSSDYTPISSTLTIPGDNFTTQGNIEIPVTTDNRFERDEIFYVDITSATSDITVNLRKSRGTVTIFNDDNPPLPNTKDISIDGDFSYINEDYSALVSSGSTVYIGRKSGNKRLLRVEGGSVKYNAAGLTITNGKVYSMIGGIDKPIFEGSTTISFNTGISTSLRDNKLPDDLKIAGLNPTFSGIFLDKQEIRLKGNLPLPSSLGGTLLSLSLGTNPTSSNALKITRDGMKFGNDLPISNTSFNLFGMIPVNLPNFDLIYENNKDLLKLQGAINLSPFSKLTGFPNLRVDLTDKNFIQIKNAKTDLVGKLSLQNFKFGDKWGVDEASITVDTIQDKVGADFEISFPFPLPFKGNGVRAKLGGEFLYNPLALNRISGGGRWYPGIPLGAIPLEIVGLGGGLDNLSPRDEDPFEFSGSITMEDTASLGLEIEGSVKISREKLAVEGEIILIDEDLFIGDVKTEINWNKMFYSGQGNIEILGGLLFGKGKLTASMLISDRQAPKDGDFAIGYGGQMGVRVPEFVPYIGGKTLSKTTAFLSYNYNNNYKDDFAIAWKEVDLSWLPFSDTKIAAGVYVNLHDRDVKPFGFKISPRTSSFEITPNVDGTNRDWILMAAEWANPTSDVRVRVQKPDGTWIDESDFVDHGFAIVDEFSDKDTRTVAVVNPTPGIWDIEVVDSTGLGAIEYIASESTIKPTIELTSPTVNVLGGEVNIEFEAFDADSEAEITFFYDTDGEGYDGFRLPGTLLETDGAGTYLWNTQGMPPGDYFIYAMIQDDVNEPIFSDYAQGSIKVEESANLAVDSSISEPLVRPGEEVTYTVTVTNTEGGTAQDVELINYIPQGATLVSSSADFAKTEDDEDEGYKVQLGDIALGETVAIDLTVNTPNQAGTITNIAQVVSNTYDPEVFDDVSVFASTVDTFKADPVLVDLSVETTTDVLLPKVGEEFTISFTVFNNSKTDATGVSLVGNLSASLSELVPNMGSIDTNNVLTVDLNNIEAGKSKTVTVRTKAPDKADIFNVLDVRANEEDVDLIDNLVTQTIFFTDYTDSTQETETENTVIESINPTNPIRTVTQDGNEMELIDLTGKIGETVTVTYEISREADFDNNVYFYTVNSDDGNIDGVTPSDSGYLEKALNNVVSDGLTAADDTKNQAGSFNLTGGSILGIAIIADGTLDRALNNLDSVEGVYLSYMGAGASTENGKFDHIRYNSATSTFEFEDLANGGDQDFNDITIKMEF